ncbi:MAG TPA: hypothetical protein PL141_00905 [Thermoflexales bacterium]|nr:hypothetical protein [Thermoflexales bacterium]HQW35997.1 hypothetical protein [Thermoflexales bacterium]
MGKYYTIPENNVFIEHVIKRFSKYLEDRGYSVTSTKNIKFNCEIIYSNDNRRIEIKNNYDYTDYGFSVFIFETQKNEYNILANVPFGEEDKECAFIDKAADFLLNDPEIDALISGKMWKEFNKIFYWIRENY